MAQERKRRGKRDTAAEAADVGSEAGEEGIEAVADGCGCDIIPVIILTLVAGASLLVWSN